MSGKEERFRHNSNVRKGRRKERPDAANPHGERNTTFIRDSICARCSEKEGFEQAEKKRDGSKKQKVQTEPV